MKKVWRYTIFVNDVWKYDAVFPESLIPKLKQKFGSVEQVIEDYIIDAKGRADNIKASDKITVVLDDIIRVKTLNKSFTRDNRPAFVFKENMTI